MEHEWSAVQRAQPGLIFVMLEQSPRDLFPHFSESVFLHPFNHSHEMKEVSKRAILPLTVLMHYNDTPTTHRRPSKTHLCHTS